jgi:MarR family transcriptional regulator, organic hydroperoxide resistance regulator
MMNRQTKRPARVRQPSPASTSSWRDALSDERIAHLIKNAFRGTSRALQTRLSKHSVQYGHWTLLRVLWQTDGLTQRQLSEQAGVTEPSTFAALQRMEQLGYIARQKMPANNKQIRIFLTPKGTALRTVSVSAAKDVNRIALSGVSAADIAATRRTLIAIIENLYADPMDSTRPRTSAASMGPGGEREHSP